MLPLTKRYEKLIDAPQANLLLDIVQAANLAPNVALVDDVLSTGAQFKATKKLLLSHFPHLHVAGIFAARRSLLEGEKLDFLGLF